MELQVADQANAYPKNDDVAVCCNLSSSTVCSAAKDLDAQHAEGTLTLRISNTGTYAAGDCNAAGQKAAYQCLSHLHEKRRKLHIRCPDGAA